MAELLVLQLMLQVKQQCYGYYTGANIAEPLERPDTR